MSDEITRLAQSLGVDEAAVQQILAFAAKGKSAPLDTEVQGFVSCTNTQCDRHGEDRPVRVQVDHAGRTYKDAGGDLPFLENSSAYYMLEDDGELVCPGCGRPCAVIPGKRREIPKRVDPMSGAVVG